jgi:prefoldin subunit 5
MVDVDVQTELTQVNTQLEQLVNQLNQLNAQKNQLEQQIHNLNGIAMYLRGKQENDGSQPEAEISSNNNVVHNEIPDIAEIVNDS